jgi:transposase
MHSEEFKKQVVAFKDNGHTFKELKEVFGIQWATYCRWKKNKEATGSCGPKYGKCIKIRKIDPEKLMLAVAENPDMSLQELAEKFECSISSIRRRIKQLDINRVLYRSKSYLDNRRYITKLDKLLKSNNLKI